ncbi:mersacidin family lantibiotic [Paenibacillus agri]|uniref:Type 2 lantibiotic n=1 Tax=Paenibacillus agri TaxID=2744309 RepID=A0A850EIA1_9BACL|nr:mersacidin family lantibiotic [Paenibacillus agri]NUU59117.1 type 2 lantibiotic [Paenibacillus agri]
MNRKAALRSLDMENPAGSPLVELGDNELMRIHGGADVQPETTPVCGFFVGVGIGVILSVVKC